jgi:hypothetical protein
MKREQNGIISVHVVYAAFLFFKIAENKRIRKKYKNKLGEIGRHTFRQKRIANC